MRKLPNPAVGTNFLDAFKTMVGRIDDSIKASGNRKLALPVRMYVAGGVAAHFYEVRLLSPVDLAISKLARFAEHDQEDIRALATEWLLNSKDLKRRAEEALRHYIGNPDPIKTSITLACRMVDKSRRR